MTSASSLVRPLAAAGVLGLVAAGTAACGGTSYGTGPGCDLINAGSTSDSVKVSGTFGKEQTATIPSGLKASGTQRSIVSVGKGAMTKKGDQVDAYVSIYLQSGKKVDAEEVSIQVGDQSLAPALRGGASCVPVGSRVVVTAQAKDIVGPQGNSQLGIGAGDSLVIITDVVSTKAAPSLPKPADWANPPAVTFGADGTPSLKLTGTPDPNYELKVLQAGTGDTVQSGDQVTVNYQGTSWDTGQVFDQSYGPGKQPATFATGGVVPGFGGALVGQKVGTKLVVTIPPKLAYGEKGAGGGSALEGQTLVFVISIEKTKR